MRYSEQTISDCLLLGSGRGSAGIIDVFDFTRTSGASDCLRQMITSRLESLQEINDMQDAIRFAAENINALDFEIINAEVQYIREYFRMSTRNSGPSVGLYKRLKYRYGNDPGFSYIRSNVMRILFFLNDTRKKFPANIDGYPKILKQLFDRLRVIFEDPENRKYISKTPAALTIPAIIKTDYFLQQHFRVLFEEIMDNLCRLEAIVSVAKAFKKHGFVFPEFSTDNEFRVNDIFHVLIPKAVRNDLLIGKDKNLLFLTGANMSGKSSFLRSVGALVCLAHCGFPVPAKNVVIPFYEAISVNISVQDNMMKGYSRFYNEMLAVKELLYQLSSGKTCFAIFDELFIGTNLNDAVSCSKILLGSLHSYMGSHVMISSHNIQMAGEGSANMQFNFIESGIEDGKPVFSYKLRPGKNETALGLFLFERMRAELEKSGIVVQGL